MKALKINVRDVGDKTTLSLRPERVIVNPAGENIDNIFEGQVEELIYLGDHVRTRVNVCGNDEFVVKIPNAKGNLKIAKGQHVRLGWSSNDCRALDPYF